MLELRRNKVSVKLIDIDPKTGKFKLSRKALLPAPKSRNNRQQGKLTRWTIGLMFVSLPGQPLPLPIFGRRYVSLRIHSKNNQFRSE